MIEKMRFFCKATGAAGSDFVDKRPALLASMNLQLDGIEGSVYSPDSMEKETGDGETGHL